MGWVLPRIVSTGTDDARTIFSAMRPKSIQLNAMPTVGFHHDEVGPVLAG